MEYSTLAYSENDGILHVRLNRPEKRNAVNKQMFMDIGHFFSETASQPGIYAVLISGEGKCFSAGTDLASFDQNTISQDSSFVRLVQQAYSEIESLEKAVIALIHGHCIGIGLELALACDLRICSDDALFSIPEVQLGLIPDDGGCQRLPHVIGLGRAKEMILTGKTINAEKAEKWGLVNDVVPTSELQRTGLKWAQEIKNNGLSGVGLAKLNIDFSLSVGLRSGLEHARLAQRLAIADPSFRKRIEQRLVRKDKL